MEKTGKRFLIVGAGKQSAAIAHYLFTKADAELVSLFDSSPTALGTVHERWGAYGGRLRVCLGDASNVASMTEWMRGYDVAIGAASYKLNAGLTEAAIAAGVDFLDLGGNPDVVAKQFALSEKAAAAGVRIFPDCGVAPGMASILAADGINALGGQLHVKSVSIYCGGLPQYPVGMLKHALFFAVSGLINEYKERCEVLRRGERTLVRSLTEKETIVVPHIGTLEAVHTAGGASTLVSTYQGVAGGIEDICYKTLRYPGDPGMFGHWDIMGMVRDMGWFEDKWAKVVINDQIIMPREFFEAWLEQSLPHDGPDVLVLRVIVQAKDGRTVTYDVADRMDEATDLTAMKRTTGYSAAIIAEMLTDGSFKNVFGTLRQELSVPTGIFIERLRACGIDVRIT